MVVVEGHVGALRVAYQTAVRLSAWRLSLLPELPRRYRFTARAVVASEYWLAEGPLDLVLVVGGDLWVWRGVMPQVAGGQASMTITGSPAVAAGQLRTEQ